MIGKILELKIVKASSPEGVVLSFNRILRTKGYASVKIVSQYFDGKNHVISFYAEPEKTIEKKGD